jgi:hypothetical protein
MLRPRHLWSAAVCVAIVALASCGGGSDKDNTASNAQQPAPVPVTPIPLPQPPLDREQLLIAAEHAASNFAAGIDDGSRQRALADQKFELRIRFGCGGPTGEDAATPFGWSFDKETSALKVRAAQSLSKKDPPVAAIAGPGFEAVEGFWVQRPWRFSAVCPQPPQQPQQQPAKQPGGKTPAEQGEASPAAPPKPKPAPTEKKAAAPEEKTPPHAIGIGQFFTATDPRTMRRSGRPYEATKKLDVAMAPKGGFDLVLTGRLKALPDGRVIACTWPDGANRPSCVISAEFGKISIERVDTHAQLAEWGPG